MGKHSMTRHHLFQKCDGGNNHPDNIKRMRNNPHEALHTLFGSISLPIEKIEMILQMHESVLITEVSQDVQKILDLWKREGREAYNPDILKDNNIFNR